VAVCDLAANVTSRRLAYCRKCKDSDLYDPPRGKTVEFHLTRVYRKLNIHSRAELIRLFASERESATPDVG
jgi:hypothetical protein